MKWPGPRSIAQQQSGCNEGSLIKWTHLPNETAQIKENLPNKIAPGSSFFKLGTKWLATYLLSHESALAFSLEFKLPKGSDWHLFIQQISNEH